MKNTNTFQKRKKAQMEILGLAIVMVLLILGLVFVVKFLALKKPSDLKQSVVESQVASSYISTYLEISVPECNGLSPTELLQDCAASGGLFCDDGKSSCEKPKEVATFIFSRTFDAWKLKYEFTAFLQPEKPFFTIGTKCLGEKRSKTFPLPSRAGTLYVRLDLCG